MEKTRYIPALEKIRSNCRPILCILLFYNLLLVFILIHFCVVCIVNKYFLIYLLA